MELLFLQPAHTVACGQTQRLTDLLGVIMVVKISQLLFDKWSAGRKIPFTNFTQFSFWGLIYNSTCPSKIEIIYWRHTVCILNLNSWPLSTNRTTYNQLFCRIVGCLILFIVLFNLNKIFFWTDREK